ncbi:MAG: BrnT family toxin [Acidobacteriota bacterium]|nr:BrnT family toxin [Acidobacteriota bacterium]
MHECQFQFEWDDVKAVTNLRKHNVSFDLARTIFNDPFLLTIADLGHGETEERWFSIGRSGNGAILSAVYLWTEVGPATTSVRIISARKATRTEILQYDEESL